jgi:hypothetical protein
MLNRTRTHLEICAALSEAGSQINEDVAGFTKDCAWVIDGATGIGETLTSGPSDASWFAKTADATLKDILSCDNAIPTPQLLRRVIRHCADAFQREASRLPVDRYEYPSAAIALVRVRPGGLELTTLGDCRIIYRNTDGIAQMFGTSRVGFFERRTLDLAHRLLRKEPNLTTGELRTRLSPQLRENRLAMNRPGGYWVLGIDEAAVDHIDQTVIPFDDGPVALASDGFLRLLDLFEAVAPDAFLEIRNDAQARSRLPELRRLEAADPDCRKFLRVKPSDDASLVVVRGIADVWGNDKDHLPLRGRLS